METLTKKPNTAEHLDNPERVSDLQDLQDAADLPNVPMTKIESKRPNRPDRYYKEAELPEREKGVKETLVVNYDQWPEGPPQEISLITENPEEKMYSSCTMNFTPGHRVHGDFGGELAERPKVAQEGVIDGELYLDNFKDAGPKDIEPFLAAIEQIDNSSS